MGVLSRGSPNVYPDRVILVEILWASNSSRFGSSPRRNPSHAAKSRHCRECASHLQRRPGLRRPEETALRSVELYPTTSILPYGANQDHPFKCACYRRTQFGTRTVPIESAG